MRIALLGSNGQLGRDLVRALSAHQVLALTRAEFDVTDHARSRSVLGDLRPEIIVNTTAYHRVDDCESQPDSAYAVNVVAVKNLVGIANDLNAAFVHLSTDYVFDGKSADPYTESSPPRPLSVYGKSKLEGENVVRTESRKYFIIRSCGLYGKAGSRGKGGNFVETMLDKARRGQKIQVVEDQRVTPTYTRDLAQQIAILIPTDHHGLYHVTNEGACSWYEFAQTIFELAGVEADLTPTSSEMYRTPAIRPRNSVLENANLKKLGLNRMRHWREALAAYLNE
jgi:dTDP-4-dehydrorhamnose reductase